MSGHQHQHHHPHPHHQHHTHHPPQPPPAAVARRWSPRRCARRRISPGRQPMGPHLARSAGRWVSHPGESTQPPPPPPPAVPPPLRQVEREVCSPRLQRVCEDVPREQCSMVQDQVRVASSRVTILPAGLQHCNRVPVSSKGEEGNTCKILIFNVFIFFFMMMFVTLPGLFGDSCAQCGGNPHTSHLHQLHHH